MVYKVFILGFVLQVGWITSIKIFFYHCGSDAGLFSHMAKIVPLDFRLDVASRFVLLIVKLSGFLSLLRKAS